jgi:hypothetical protein
MFKGPDTATLFGRWLFSKAKKGCTAVAHNSGGYDAYFLVNYLIKNGLNYDVIYNGSKIMYIEVFSSLGIRLIDSLNFLPMALKALPKAFGLD